MIKMTYENLTRIFNVCSCCNLTTPADVKALIDFIQEGLLGMATYNYPYPAFFYKDLPAWPVYRGCEAAARVYDPEEDTLFNFVDIRRLARMFKVWQGDQCINLTGSPFGSREYHAWDVQTCRDMAMPIGNDPDQSAYGWANWEEAAHTQHCMQTYGMTPRYDWALDYFGGRNARRDFRDHTNLVWVNGEFDPWHGGAVTTNVSSGTTSIFVKQAAAHYDLRMPHVNDTVQIKEARAIEAMHVERWIANWKMNINV